MAGFVNDTTSGVICRYTIHGLTVDIIPTHSEALGFSNRWYPAGFRNAIPYTLDDQTTIRIFSLPYFIASKLEAFKNRGHNSFRFSSDFEDIVYVLENSKGAAKELTDTDPALRAYLQEEFTALLKDPGFSEGVLAHLDPHTAAQSLQKILGLTKTISQ